MLQCGGAYAVVNVMMSLPHHHGCYDSTLGAVQISEIRGNLQQRSGEKAGWAIVAQNLS